MKRTTPYLVAFGLGLTIMPLAIEAAYHFWGYRAAGGEYLIMGILLSLAMVHDEITKKEEI